MTRNRIVLSFVILSLAFVLNGCSDRTINGEVSDVHIDEATGNLRFTLIQEGVKSIEVTTDQYTHIFSWLDEITEADLLAGNREGIMVSVTGKTEASGIAASQIQIDQLLTKNVHTLRDGTQINMLTAMSHKMYCLEDGTELLMVRNPSGPENVSVGGIETLSDLPEAVQQEIIAYYHAQGILYDEWKTLEDAYCAYRIAPDAFETYVLGQDIAPTASNDRIICFLTCVIIPAKGTHLTTELRLGAVFDKETGQIIPAEDLFACSREEIIAELAKLCKLDDPVLIAEMEAAFRPEYVILFPDNLEITFPEGTLPSNGLAFGMGFDYSPEVLELLQPWAVPKGRNIE